MTEKAKHQDLNDPTTAARLERYATANSSIDASESDAAAAAAGPASEITASRTSTWSLHEHDPIYWTSIVFTVYDSGDWKISCNVENRSGHSDWDVWLTLRIKSRISNAIVCTITEEACFQDLDSGENYNKESSGFSTCIRDNWAQIANGNFFQTFSSWKQRDD